MNEEAAEVFGRIYDTDHWRGGSGEGSTGEAAQPYRSTVELLLAARDVRTVVDVGCGDWQVGNLIDWSPVTYVGVDVVPGLVEHHQRTNARPGVEFRIVDARHDAVPVADLVLVKDVLQHWPLADIRSFLDRELPRHRYLLATNDVASVHFPGPVNADTPLGGWRTLDLAALGYRPAWSMDFDVRGEWTKRMDLYAARGRRLVPRSARRLVHHA